MQRATMSLLLATIPNLYFADTLNDKEICPAKTFARVIDIRLSIRNTCMADGLKAIEQWRFSDRSVLQEALPVEEQEGKFVRQVRGYVFSHVKPVSLERPLSLVAVSSDVLTEILDIDAASAEVSQTFLEFAAGGRLLKNSAPMSHRYGGHQVWAHEEILLAWMFPRPHPL